MIKLVKAGTQPQLQKPAKQQANPVVVVQGWVRDFKLKKSVNKLFKETKNVSTSND